MYNSIKRYYKMGKYTKEQIKVFVLAGWISEDQFKEITGDEYAA